MSHFSLLRLILLDYIVAEAEVWFSTHYLWKTRLKVSFFVHREVSQRVAPLWEDSQLLQSVPEERELLAGCGHMSESQRLIGDICDQWGAAVHTENRGGFWRGCLWAQRSVQVSCTLIVSSWKAELHGCYYDIVSQWSLTISCDYRKCINIYLWFLKTVNMFLNLHV